MCAAFEPNHTKDGKAGAYALDDDDGDGTVRASCR